MTAFRATLIISVYKDTEALEAIVNALDSAESTDLEIIVSEDGEDPQMRSYVRALQARRPDVVHLTQEDWGFRKNRALNRAVAAARGDYLVFIDGDCVPHRHFIRSHLGCAERHAVCAGRRVELGPSFSRVVRRTPRMMRLLQIPPIYWLLAIPMTVDHVKNYEAGFFSRWLHRLNRNKPGRILGCNFSCYRDELLAINGFNEDYVQPGIGEDSDIQWRLERRGARLKNIKFLAVQYHLHHPSRYQPSPDNQRIFRDTQQRDAIVCEHGIDQHLQVHAASSHRD